MTNTNAPPTTEIRIISLWQPWATLIALGLKQYETRSWSTDYRGKLAIHAAKRPVNKDELADISYSSAGHLTWEQMSAIDYPLGQIVAIADLTACLEMVGDISRSPSEVANIHLQTWLETAVGDWQTGRYAWKLENVVALPQPIPFKGGQGLRRLTDAEALKAIESMVGVAA